MAVILAKYAGFCFGVQRAVSTVYDIIEKEGKITVDCEFCDNKYEFNKEDVDRFLK